jgi:hypothetical protein
VYTCARESGYNVLEISTSQRRSGKEILAVIGEACTTQRLLKSETYSKQSFSKTLVLLDDVDVLMAEDKGFWTALSNILPTSKCPIILTFTGTIYLIRNSI